MRIATALTALVLSSIAALAQEEPYLDDRSNAETLVRSLYNAIGRKEYARAWDYFGEQKPSKSFEDFREGYADTDRVEVVTGGISEEGAAGSIFYNIPVAIRASTADGDSSIFAGCYTARLTSPQLQEPPFRGLHLEKGSLKLAEGELGDVLPASCGDGPPAVAQDPVKAKAMAIFKVAYKDICQTLDADAEPNATEPEVHEIKFRYPDTPETDPEMKRTLYKFGCITGAYNTGEVYYIADDFGEVTQVQFAEPDLDIRYQDPDEQTKLDSMTIIGWETTDQLVNSFYDEKEKSLTSWAKWRGVGDQSSTAKYIFREGQFTLVHYEVDPTADGEINGEVVVDFDTGP
ncbi:MAG TPA: DUF1176 domain-containing protein [Rhizobiaceae bacterium]|nr:DUF1176 domain-containing protein [Rhizobiaceae bacterium]